MRSFERHSIDVDLPENSELLFAAKSREITGKSGALSLSVMKLCAISEQNETFRNQGASSFLKTVMAVSNSLSIDSDAL